MELFKKLTLFILSLCLSAIFVVLVDKGMNRGFDYELSASVIMEEANVFDSATEQDIAEIISRILIIRNRDASVDLSKGSILIEDGNVIISRRGVIVEANLPNEDGYVFVTVRYGESIAKTTFRLLFVND